MKKKGSLRRISPEMRSQIFEAALKEENRAKKRSVLAEELETKFGDKSPTLETLEKLISKARHHPRSPLDEQWSTACLAQPQYSIPPEALPTVLLIWSMSQVPPDEPLTIREALWVSRLYRLVGNLDFLYVYAKWYASGERWPEIAAGVSRESVSSFSDRYTRRQAIEKALPYDHFGGSVYTLEEIAKSVFWAAPKGNEVITDEAMKEGYAELTAKLAINANAAQMPARFSQVQQWVKKTLEQQLSEIPQWVREMFPSPEPSPQDKMHDKMNELSDRVQALLKGQQKGGTK